MNHSLAGVIQQALTTSLKPAGRCRKARAFRRSAGYLGRQHRHRPRWSRRTQYRGGL